MGQKKRNLARRSKILSQEFASRCDGPISDEQRKVNSVEDPCSRKALDPDKLRSSSSIIKLEFEKALIALRRGNHTKALRLMKDLCLREEISKNSALVYRVQGTIYVKVASIMDDPHVKYRYLKCAIDSARKAVSLSPNSVEFAHFYANLLFEMATEGKEYEEVVQECERALSIENPVDPAKENLQDESQHKIRTADGRISHVHQELRSLIQKSSIASLSTWMNNLGNGEERFRFLPLRRHVEDPMELKIVLARQSNEIKKATKTHEERTKEIEVRVAAARLLQQKSAASQSHPENGNTTLEETSSGSSNKVAERKKSANTRRISSFAEGHPWVYSYWKSLSVEMRKTFLSIEVDDLKTQIRSIKDSIPNVFLLEALSFAEANRSWKSWVCCRCNDKFSNPESHIHHIVHEHMGSLLPRMQSILPRNPDDNWIDMLLSSSWKPLDVYTSAKVLEEEFACCHDNSSEHKKDSYLKEKWFAYSWTLSDDLECAELLERIGSNFTTLIKHKCLSDSHLNKVMEMSRKELRRSACGSEILKHGLDQTPLAIHFLGAPQLRKLIKYLQAVTVSSGIGKSPMKSSPSVPSVAAYKSGSNEIGKLVFSEDASNLILDECFLPGVSASQPGKGDIEADPFLSWIFTGTTTNEEVALWIQTRDEKVRCSMEILEILEKEFCHLERLCERKHDHISYGTILNSLEELCHKEGKEHERSTETENESSEALLRKRKDDLERENDVLDLNPNFELDAVRNILKEAENIKFNQSGPEDSLAGSMTSQLQDLELEDRWRNDGGVQLLDACIEMAIQRQKIHLSLELGKLDTRIMQTVNGMQQSELDLEPVSLHDYQSLILPLLKSLIRARLEQIAEKDATEKSDAAREAFLAELDLDAGETEAARTEKLKERKKNKDSRKKREAKQRLSPDETTKRMNGEAVTDTVSSFHEDDDAKKQRDRELRRRGELEAEERMLEETLEYQRRVESEAKQKHLARQSNRAATEMEAGSPDLSTVVVPPLSDEDLRRKRNGDGVVVSPSPQREAVGAGLKNEAGEYNCFLNSVIQSLWHLRRFQQEFKRRITLNHVHVGDPCVACALHGVFDALTAAAAAAASSPSSISPTSLRTALSNLYPDSSFFQQGEMNDASEVVCVIFECLHRAFASGVRKAGSWDCGDADCMAHGTFGMDVFEKMNCRGCGLESRHLKYTSFFHHINASALRTMRAMSPESSFGDLLNLVEMNHLMACDPQFGGCGKSNHIHHILSSPPPHVFSLVVGWQRSRESADDISHTLAAIDREIDLSVLYCGLDPNRKHSLVSMVSYYGQHYHCFAYNNDRQKWILYDDKIVKVIGGWGEVLVMCERGHLQPHVLFYESKM